MPAIAASPERLLTDGAAAVVEGALAGGCRFFAGYPITPASTILSGMLRALPAAGGVGVQAEDEIGALSMCIGAAMAGLPAMTATSGPGISLYSENVGLAIMGEVPLVIVDVQRLGPATGGATTVGQGDVQFVRWGCSGGYPIIALAPSSLTECRDVTERAFRLAERFRCPAFILADKELVLTLATEERSVPAVASSGAEAARRDEPAPPRIGFRPYRYDPPDEVPPLAPFGGPELVRFTGSSHDERGFLSKDPATVGALNRHLQEKIERHVDEIAWLRVDRDAGATTLVLAYGVTAGAAREAVARARADGARLSGATLLSLWPVPERALEEAWAGVERVVVAELNLGDYRREIERLARGRFEVVGVNRVDGELISPEQILEAAR